MVHEPKKLFSAKAGAYDRYVSLFLYPRGLRAVFADSAWLFDGLHVLDAGCGTGILSLAFFEAQRSHGYACKRMHGFDLTAAMLGRFRKAVERRGIVDFEFREANVLELERLPSSWRDYDMIVSASMLEYVPREKLPEALAGLRSRLRGGGTFVLFMTRRNWLTWLLVERPWGGHRYSRQELTDALALAGFEDVRYLGFPARFSWLNLWGHVVESRSPKTRAGEAFPDDTASGGSLSARSARRDQL